MNAEWGVIMKKRANAFQIAVEKQRWDLAAHILVFATLQVGASEGLLKVETGRMRKSDGKKRRPKR